MNTRPDPPFDPTLLRQGMARRLFRRSIASGNISIPAVPGMIDEYVGMCDQIFTGLGVRFNDDELAHLRAVLEEQLAIAYAGSQRSDIVISYEAPVGKTLSYTVSASWMTIEGAYQNWISTRQPPLFGTHPDARVWELAGEAADPATFRILEIGPGTGRNALPLARRGHPVDVIEITADFAEMIRTDAQRESLDINVFQSDMFELAAGELRGDYRLMVLSEVVPEFRTVDEFRRLFEFAATCLAPGGRLVFNAFLAKDGYIPDSSARAFAEQCYSALFTRGEVAGALAGLPLEIVGDDSVYDYEKAHLPSEAWPPTGWYAEWVTGLDVFDVERDQCPIELRWLVYRRF